MVSQIDKLIQHKASPCLSIIIPTKAYAGLQFFTWNAIKSNSAKARKLLLQHRSPSQGNASIVEAHLDKLIAQVDSRKFGKGMGIFISPSVTELVYFPFEVEEKLVIGESFECHELHFYRDSSYYVLMLGKNKINLFKGRGDELKEQVDGNFPMLLADDYAYSAVGATVSSEKSKSKNSKERMVTFCKEADHTLHQYLKQTDALIICGARDETASFREITNHADSLAGSVAVQNYRPLTSEQLGQFQSMIFKFKGHA